MTDEKGVLSIDFLTGFTIFILAFVWVVSMIPGIMIGLQSYTIDYDAVAYRTGVILVEDPGWPASPGWESKYDNFNRPLKAEIIRFGLAVSKDAPNILSEEKINRFFNWSTTDLDEFNLTDYHNRAIFGDYPYGFNISLMDLGGQNGSVGDVLPDGYGYIRRLVKIKGLSNATIGHANKYNSSYNKTDDLTNETSTHVFSILIDNPRLQEDVKDPAYQIDPAREQITINITDLKSTITENATIPMTLPFHNISRSDTSITLKNIKVFKKEGGLYSQVLLPASEYPYIDGSSARLSAMPAPVTDSITLKISPYFFDQMKPQNSQIYLALGFDLSNGGVPQNSTFLNNTQALPDFDSLDGQLTFDNPNTIPFNYNYDAENVTQPGLRDAVLEVAVWPGTATTTGGMVTPVGGSHTIQAGVTAGSGTISPSGSVLVADGANQIFTITPNTGSHITDVVVDGVSKGAVPSYTFTNVLVDHTITVSFAINTYTITPSVSGTGIGTISPGTVQTVNYGAMPTFTITPDASSHIADVLVNGTSVGTVTSYTFPPVTANYTINAIFAPGAAPAFTSITPASGPITGGTPVTIVGTGFASGGSFGVTIGGAAATITNVTATSITATTPVHAAGIVDVVITNNDGLTATGIGAYTYTTPITVIGPITGSPQVGSLLTAGALTPADATASYQWQSAATSGGTYSNITGATAITYTPVAGDLGYYIHVVATGTGLYTGTVTSAYVGPVTTPITAMGPITGSPPHVGGVLTAGALTPAGGTASYQWQSATTSGGPYSNIAGATATTYTPVAGDVGYYIHVVATGTGSYTGTVTSAYVGPVTT